MACGLAWPGRAGPGLAWHYVYLDLDLDLVRILPHVTSIHAMLRHITPRHVMSRHVVFLCSCSMCGAMRCRAMHVFVRIPACQRTYVHAHRPQCRLRRASIWARGSRHTRRRRCPVPTSSGFGAGGAGPSRTGLGARQAAGRRHTFRNPPDAGCEPSRLSLDSAVMCARA